MADLDLLSPETTLRVPRGSVMFDVTQRVLRPGDQDELGLEAASAQESSAVFENRTLIVPRPSEPGGQAAASSPGLTPGAAATPLHVAPRVLPLGVLAPGSRLMDNCVVRTTVRPHETMRPGLYECDAPEGRVMVKVGASEYPPREELWHQLPELRHSSLLTTWRVGMERGFYAEVQEYCEGGTLFDCLPRPGRAGLGWETVERGIVTSFLDGISYLHERGIVHRDVKPQNLYLRRNGERVSLVVADFDISSLIESDSTSRDTPRGAGTHFYMAPEAFPRFVDPGAGRAAAIVAPACDWYSFGVVLVELLTGTTPLHSGRWSDVYDFYMGGGRIELPGGLTDRATQLLQGLLIRNRRTRWGAEEVRRWLRHETSEKDQACIREDSGFQLVQRAARPYNVFSSSPRDVPGLVAAMVAEPWIAEEELMGGDVLVNWLSELDVKLASEVRRERDKWRHYPRVALTCACLRLDGTLPFVVSQGHKVAKIGDLVAQCECWFKERSLDPGQVVSLVSLMRLEAWLRLKTDPDPRSAEGIRVLREAVWSDRGGDTLSPVGVRAAWHELRWALDPFLPFTLKGHAFATPMQLVEKCYGQQEDWAQGVPTLYRAALDRWHEGVLEAWLRQRTIDEEGHASPVVNQIREVRERPNQQVELGFEIVLRLLNPHLGTVKLCLHRQGGQVTANGVSLAAEIGQTTRTPLQWEATTPGIPFAAWRLTDSPAGMHLDPVEIRTRQGTLTLDFDTSHGFEPGIARTCWLGLERGGNCVLTHRVPIAYRVLKPDSRRNFLLRNGLLLGACMGGGTRLLAYLITDGDSTGDAWQYQAEYARRQEDLRELHDPTLPVSDTAAVGNAPLVYINAGVAVGIVFLIAFYLWLDALRKYAAKDEE